MLMLCQVSSVLFFTIIFFDQIKRLLIISNFLKIDKAIVSNWYQNRDEKLMSKCVESLLQSLDSRLTYHRS